MKFLIWTILFTAFIYPIYDCPRNPLKNGQSLEDSLSILRKSNCYYKAEDFLAFAEICISKGRFSNADWALNIAKKKISSKSSSEFHRFQIAKASLLLERKKYEETIILVKPYILSKKNQSIPASYLKQYHLLGIRAYYIRAGNKKDKNVQYLISLYNHRYKNP